jgi:hypothetical protein
MVTGYWLLYFNNFQIFGIQFNTVISFLFFFPRLIAVWDGGKIDFGSGI